MATATQTAPLTANFAHTLNIPANFKVGNLNATVPVSQVTPTAAPVTTVAHVTSATTTVTSLTPQGQVSTPVATNGLPPVVSDVFDFNIVDISLSKKTTQEQQYAAAKFVFKVPRVKTALIDATVDKGLQRTIDNIETEQKKKGVNVKPLEAFDAEDQKVISEANEEYKKLLESRNKKGTKDNMTSYEKDLKTWNEIKELTADGKDTGRLAVPYVKILRDVFTLEFKSAADLSVVYGSLDNKDPTKNSGVRAWIKSHKSGDRLSIRSHCQDQNKLLVEFTYNQTNPTLSESLVQEFRTWCATNALNALVSSQRVTAEYKKKMVKDKKTDKYTEQEKEA